MHTISESAVRRLSLYLRFLDEFAEDGFSTISSDALAVRGGTTSAQVRKDLSVFGSFGKRGIGYEVSDLRARLRTILGLGRRYAVVVVGAGKVGSALVQYHGFRQRGFDVVAVYDRSPQRIGTLFDGLRVRDVARLGRDLRTSCPDIAVIDTPAEAAEEVAEVLVAGGVKAILNFAPVPLQVPDDVTVRGVNLALELEALSFALTNP